GVPGAARIHPPGELLDDVVNTDWAWRSRWPLRSLRSLRSLWPRPARDAGGTPLSLGTSIALRTLDSGVALDALRAGVPFLALGSFLTLGSGITLYALRAGVAFLALRSGITLWSRYAVQDRIIPVESGFRAWSRFRWWLHGLSAPYAVTRC